MKKTNIKRHAYVKYSPNTYIDCYGVPTTRPDYFVPLKYNQPRTIVSTNCSTLPIYSQQK